MDDHEAVSKLDVLFRGSARSYLVLIFFKKIYMVVVSFVFDKYYLIMDQQGSKDLSYKLQINYIVSYYFYLYLMLNACAVRFDVMKNLNFL